MKRAMSGPGAAKTATTIDQYLARVEPAQRRALQVLRRTVRSAVPRAEEGIGYGIPMFRLDGKMFVAFGSAARHCSFYPGAGPVRAHAKELARYSTSKGTVRFDPADPLPAALVRRLVRTRLREARQPRRRARRPGAPARRKGSAR